MPVRLLQGDFHKQDGSAVNDFELFAIGTVTNLNQYVSEVGGCDWLDSIFNQRL